MCLTACGAIESSAETLPPLGSAQPPAPSTTALAAPGLHHSWFEAHRDAVTNQRAAIRTLLGDLRAADDDHVLRLVCLKGLDLDSEASRAAYTGRDAHPMWIRTIDLTRWMIASCNEHARQTVDDMTPRIESALRRFESWSGLAHED